MWQHRNIDIVRNTFLTCRKKRCIFVCKNTQKWIILVCVIQHVRIMQKRYKRINAFEMTSCFPFHYFIKSTLINEILRKIMVLVSTLICRLYFCYIQIKFYIQIQLIDLMSLMIVRDIYQISKISTIQNFIFVIK